MRGGVFYVIQSCNEAFVLSPVLRRGQVARAEVISCLCGQRWLWSMALALGTEWGPIGGFGRGNPGRCFTVVMRLP